MAADETNLAKFAQRAMSDTVTATAAITNLNSDAPTNTVKMFTTGSKGGILTRLTVLPRGTCTATSLLLFTSKDAGTTKKYKDSETLAAQTAGVSGRNDEVVFGNYSEARPGRLGPNVEVYVGLGVAQTAGVDFSYEYSDFAVA